MKCPYSLVFSIVPHLFQTDIWPGSTSLVDHHLGGRGEGNARTWSQVPACRVSSIPRLCAPSLAAPRSPLVSMDSGALWWFQIVSELGDPSFPLSPMLCWGDGASTPSQLKLWVYEMSPLRAPKSAGNPVPYPVPSPLPVGSNQGCIKSKHPCVVHEASTQFSQHSLVRKEHTSPGQGTQPL